MVCRVRIKKGVQFVITSLTKLMPIDLIVMTVPNYNSAGKSQQSALL